MSVCKYLIPTLCFISAPLLAQSAEERATQLVDLIMPQSEYDEEMACVLEFIPGSDQEKRAFLSLMERLMPFDVMRNSFIEAYLTTFTAEELEEGIQLYSSPIANRWRKAHLGLSKRVLQDLQTKIMERLMAIKDSPEADKIFLEIFGSFAEPMAESR